MFGEFSLYLKLLWVQSFYKTNWASTALELLTLLAISAWMLARDRSWWKLILLVFAAPVFSEDHALILNEYAPRAIHGAMVVKAIFVGLLLAEFSVAYRRSWVPGAAVATVAIAYLGHYFLLTSNRAHNHTLMIQREKDITNQLRTCTSPCVIDARSLGSDLRWDWYMPKPFPKPFVLWIREKNGINKDVQVLTL